MSASALRPRPPAENLRARAPAASAIAGLTLLAALLRLPTLALQSFWLDEAYTERLMRMSLGQMLHAIPHTESTPPLYYVLAWLWTRVCTDSEFGLRSLSALAGIATVPVVYWTAQRLGGRRAALIAGLIVATSPLMVWFSQEARAYALAALEASIALLCLVGYLQTRRTAWLAGWAAAASLGLATHYFSAFVVAPEVAWLAWTQRRRWGPALTVALAVVVVVAIALVPLALAQRGTGHADYIAQGSLATRTEQLPKQLLVGYASPDQGLTTALVALALVAGAVVPLLRFATARRRMGLALTVGLAGVLVPIALALAGIDFLNTRNVLMALPALAVATALALDAWTPPSPGVVCAAVLATIGVVVIVLVDTHPRYQRDDWRGVSHALGAATGPRAIVVSPGSGLVALQAYQPGVRTMTTAAAVAELDVVLIPGQVTGGGIGALAPAATVPAAPAGFVRTATVRAATYEVVRYRAAPGTRPTLVPAVAAAEHLGSDGVAVLLQEPAR